MSRTHPASPPSNEPSSRSISPASAIQCVATGIHVSLRICSTPRQSSASDATSSNSFSCDLASFDPAFIQRFLQPLKGSVSDLDSGSTRV